MKTIPDEWYLPKATTNEEAELIRDYINENIKRDERPGWVRWAVEDCWVYHAVFKNGKYYTGYNFEDNCRKFTKISIEEFQKHVLKIEDVMDEPVVKDEDYSYLIPIMKELNII